jgi:hypothetical protein
MYINGNKPSDISENTSQVLLSYEMCFWRSMRSGGPVIGKLRNIYRVKEKHPTYNKREKANWNGHTLRRNCLLRHAIEERIGI